MITCVIIDDEKPARDALELMINRYFPEKIRVAGKAESVKEGVFSIYKHKPDLVFLDIEMPEEDGFRLFNYFQKVPFSVIFTTAYKEYAIKAIKLAALDYIMKPVGIQDLREALELFEKKQTQGVAEEALAKFLDAMNNHSSVVEKVALPTFSGFQMEKVNEIMYCVADQNYTEVYLAGRGKIIISKPLSVMAELLPQRLFFRIHKSYLVNLNYVKSFSRDEGFHIILENGVRLDVAGRRKDDFVKALTGR